ncbi:MAG: response regulator transcription factor [Bacteroidota bacterium]
MKNLDLIIVEDSKGFALEVEMLIKESGYNFLGTYGHSEKALAAIERKRPDLVLMDIHIHGLRDGVNLAQEIKKFNIPVIFMTSLTDPATYQEAKKSLNYAYLVKPFDMLTLRNAIEMAVKLIHSASNESTSGQVWKEDVVANEYFLIKDKGVLKKVYSSEIFYAESDWNYCVLVAAEKKFVLKMPLKKILEKLGDQFVPIHKSYIVQFDKIEGIDTSTNKVIVNDTPLPLGRTYKERLLNRFNLLK